MPIDSVNTNEVTIEVSVDCRYVRIIYPNGTYQVLGYLTYKANENDIKTFAIDTLHTFIENLLNPEPPQRYYFVSYVIRAPLDSSRVSFVNEVLDENPLKILSKRENDDIKIISYQEITKSEYDMFKENK